MRMHRPGPYRPGLFSKTQFLKGVAASKIAGRTNPVEWRDLLKSSVRILPDRLKAGHQTLILRIVVRSHFRQHAFLAQLVEALVLETSQCKFESYRRYKNIRRNNRAGPGLAC